MFIHTVLKVGITGGIGSGKTTVCKIFETLGIPVYYADERAKFILENDVSVISRVKALLSEAAYTNGKLNREYISKKVFSDKNLLHEYNSIIHPTVALDTEQWVAQQKAPYVLKEAALLVESGAHLLLDKLIVVAAPESVRIERVVQRDNVRAEAVQARINNQMPEEEKVKLADYVINNDGSVSLIQQALQIHHQLLDLSGT